MSRVPRVTKDFLEKNGAPNAAIGVFGTMRESMVRLEDFYGKVKGDRWEQEISIWLFAQSEFVGYFSEKVKSLSRLYLGMALEKMARSAQYEDIKKYLDAGFVLTGHGCHQLMQGAAEGNDVRIGEMFRDHGISVNENHGNAMHIANIYGNVEMARFLLESGIDLSRGHGLHSLAMIELFVEFGVSPEKYINQTLALAPYREESFEMIKRLLRIERVNINCDEGCVLRAAAECGKCDEAELIMASGFDLLRYGPASIEIAIEKEKYDVAFLIAERLRDRLRETVQGVASSEIAAIAFCPASSFRS